jgi:cyclopropane-fatty-acyl-phospholipid synthase
MSSSTSSSVHAATARRPVAELPGNAPAAARAVTALLHALRNGSLDLQWPDGTVAHFGAAHGDNECRAAIRLLDWGVCAKVLKSGDIGFAESYFDGHWTSPDLVALLQLFASNRQALEDAIYGSWWGALAYRVKHLLNRNSRQGSRKNIHAHYDIGNPFYSLWLDETMNYSSAWFAGDLSRPTADAQTAKVQRALDECAVKPGDRLLEIGCGWGALAEEAAVHLDARVTGVTLSAEQLEFARARMQRKGVADRCDLRLQDYRDINDGPFDAIASIEMFEAVGREYWGGFFATLARQLKPGGRACIQTITIDDALFERYVRSTDFIQQYIFPGGLLPSPQAFRAEANTAGLVVENELAFGADYAETLRRWRLQFLARDRQVRDLGFDTRFIRIWEFYLAYCEAAFAAGNTSVMQFTLRRP